MNTTLCVLTASSRQVCMFDSNLNISKPDIQNIRVDQGYQCQPLDSSLVGIQFWFLNSTKSTNMFFNPSLHHRLRRWRRQGVDMEWDFNRIWASRQHFATSEVEAGKCRQHFLAITAFIAAPQVGIKALISFNKLVCLVFFCLSMSVLFCHFVSFVVFCVAQFQLHFLANGYPFFVSLPSM